MSFCVEDSMPEGIMGYVVYNNEKTNISCWVNKVQSEQEVLSTQAQQGHAPLGVYFLGLLLCLVLPERTFIALTSC